MLSSAILRLLYALIMYLQSWQNICLLTYYVYRESWADSKRSGTFKSRWTADKSSTEWIKDSGEAYCSWSPNQAINSLGKERGSVRWYKISSGQLMKAYLEPKEINLMAQAATNLRDRLLIHLLFHLLQHTYGARRIYLGHLFIDILRRLTHLHTGF